MEFDDELVFLLGEIAAFEVGAEVVNPAEAATLAASEEAGGLGEGAPAALAVSSDVGNEAVVFFLGPGSLVGVSLLAARRPSHLIRDSISLSHTLRAPHTERERETVRFE